MILLALACTRSTTDSAADGCALGPEPALTIGAGEVGYEELPDGPVELIHGPQGGYHVVLALDAVHFPLDEQLTAVLSGTVAGEEIAHTEPFVTLRCNPASGTQQAWNLFLILDTDLGPEAAHGQAMEVGVLLEGAAHQAEAAAVIEVNYPELD